MTNWQAPPQLVHMPMHMHVLGFQHWQHNSPGVDSIMTETTALRHVFCHESSCCQAGQAQTSTCSLLLCVHVHASRARHQCNVATAELCRCMQPLLTLMLTSDVRGCKLPLLLQMHRPIKIHTQIQCRLSHVIPNSFMEG